MRRVLIALVIIIAVLFGLLVWMAGGFQSPRTYEAATATVGPAHPIGEAVATTTVTVVVWNIAWGYGWGSEGTGKARQADHFQASVEKMGRVLEGLGADIVLLQEIDFDATRSGRFDQAKKLAELAKLPHVAYAPSWEANWVPFPYWPPSEHFGHMSSGGAILSRYPISKNTVRLLEKPDEYAWWYNLFYLFRYLQQVEIAVGGRKIQVLNTHLEAFKEKNRIEQARVVKGAIEELKGVPVIFGGDLNAVPPEATLKKDYPDETKVKTTHEADDTVAIIRGTTGLKDAFPAATYSADERACFTFPAHEPNRKLDHLFYSDPLELIEARVAQEAGDVSDHLPLLIKLKLRKI